MEDLGYNVDGLISMCSDLLALWAICAFFGAKQRARTPCFMQTVDQLLTTKSDEDASQVM